MWSSALQLTARPHMPLPGTGSRNVGGKRNTYPAEEAGRMAHKEFLQKCKKGTKEPVLIIIDI